MGAGQAMDDPAIQPAGAEHEASVADRHHEVVGGQHAIGRHPRATRPGDLVVAQRGPGQHVDHPARGKVDDLGVDCVRVQRLLGPEMGTHLALQRPVGVAEPAEKPSTRRADDAGEHGAGATPRPGQHGGRGQRRWEG